MERAEPLWGDMLKPYWYLSEPANILMPEKYLFLILAAQYDPKTDARRRVKRNWNLQRIHSLSMPLACAKTPPGVKARYPVWQPILSSSCELR
jgi:hypothetical protein